MNECIIKPLFLPLFFKLQKMRYFKCSLLLFSLYTKEEAYSFIWRLFVISSIFYYYFLMFNKLQFNENNN